ncbi:unnamed protein product [Euphydryas editha]|uniref:Reverse transcriptase domain-containing protein n=1 Tax=Euphydryas editha TaxID=104508 RepID=A0AAU9TJL2_EUPED|nr:unnamed protein product [Euphydryas editha]
MIDIYYQNVRGLRTKTNKVMENILNSDYKIVALTETWLNSSISSNELFDSRYIVHRKDRFCSPSNSKKDGGGILIAVSKDISSCRMSHWETDGENMWVILDIVCGQFVKRIGVCVVYLPPPVKVETAEKLFESIDIVINQIDDVIIMGDFNMSFIEWSAGDDVSCMVPSKYNNVLGYSLIDFLSANDLHQYNIIKNCDDRLLDLVISNMANVTVAKPLDSLSKLDLYHPNLLISFSYSRISYLRPKVCMQFNFYRANYAGISDELNNIDWYHRFSNCEDVNAMVTIFYNVLYDIIERLVPKRKNRNSKYPDWFKHSLIKLLKEKERLRIRYRKYGNPRDKLEYEILRNRCRDLFNNCYNSHKRNLEYNISKNPSSFWNYIKSKRNTKFLPTSMSLDGESTGCGREVANFFATHFSSAYRSKTMLTNTPNNLNNATLANNSHSMTTFNKIVFYETEVIKKIKSLDLKKGPGPDGIPPIFVKRCGNALAFPLTVIFNNSLKNGIFPEEWKKARIVPVYKKGDRVDVKNYRPISILSCFSKLFESLVYPSLSKYFSNIITHSQHGFRHGLSTQTNLTVFTSDLALAMDKGDQVDAIYTDFSCAFDKVNHHILIKKLHQYGLGNTLIGWFQSYLTQRPLKVAVNGFESDTYFAESGVPQGSHLGPLLFLVFINDITQNIKNCRCSLFADDLKIYKTVKTKSDIDLLQQDLNNIIEWCHHNKMTLNVEKCSHIKFTRKKKPLVSSYSIGNVLLQEKSQIKDLGVTIDGRLTFVAHVDNIVVKAAQNLGFIKRNTQGFSRRTKTILYNSLVRSCLEYASVIWNPQYSIHSQRIESIQRAFTRHLAFYENNFSHRQVYGERLARFHMISLRSRREVSDLTFLHNILNNKVTNSEITERVLISVPSRTHRSIHAHKIFYIPCVKSHIGKQAPLVRLCNKYNSISKSIPGIDIFHDSLSVFRRKLLSYYKMHD